MINRNLFLTLTKKSKIFIKTHICHITELYEPDEKNGSVHLVNYCLVAIDETTADER